jgi:GH18 family chitinase
MKHLKIQIILLASLFFIVGCGSSSDSPTSPGPSGEWVMPYHPSYQWDRVPAEEVPWAHLTHLVVGYLWPEKDGEEYTVGIESTGWGRGWDNWRTTAQGYIDAGHNEDRKVNCMLGGAGSNPDNIWNAATSPANINTFARNIKSVLEPIGFDGVDLDWEDNVDYPSMVRLAQELRSIWPDAIITIPTGMSGSDADDLAAAMDAVDAFMPMTYISIPQWGGWVIPTPLTPLYGVHNPIYMGGSPNPYSIDYALNNWLNAGVPASKIIMGVGGYGAVWGDSNNDGRAPIEPYSNADDLIDSSGALPEGERASLASDNVVSWAWVKESTRDMTEEWDDIGRCSYWRALAVDDLVPVTIRDNTQYASLIFYETSRSIEEKVSYIKEKGMKGMGFWTLSQMMDGDSCPILETAKP